MRARTHEEVKEAIELHYKMLNLLADMSTLPNGSIMNYNSSGGGKTSEHPGGKRPSGDLRSVYDIFKARWDGCRALPDARECIKAAEDELDHWRRSKAKPNSETQQQLYRRVVRVGEGWLDRECAASLRLTMATVHAARAAHDRDAAKGLPLKGADATELLRRGNTFRYVSGVMNKSTAAVFKAARKRAA